MWPAASRASMFSIVTFEPLKVARATAAFERFAGERPGPKRKSALPLIGCRNSGDRYLSRSVRLCAPNCARREFIFWRQRSQEIAGVNAVERGIKCGVVLAGAGCVKGKLHPAAVAFGQTSDRRFCISAAVIFSDAERRQDLAVNQQRTKGDAAVDIRRAEFSSHAAVEGQLRHPGQFRSCSSALPLR